MKRLIQILFVVAAFSGMANAQEIGDEIDVNGIKAQILTIDDYGNGIAVKKVDGVLGVSSEIVGSLPTNGGYDGKRNTEELIKFITDNDYGLANFPALKKVKDMGGDWYIPGSDELKAAIVESIQVDWDVEDDLDYTQTEGYIKFSSPLAVSNMSVQSSTINDGKAIACKYYNPTNIQFVIGQNKAKCYAFCTFSTGKPRVRHQKEQQDGAKSKPISMVSNDNVHGANRNVVQGTIGTAAQTSTGNDSQVSVGNVSQPSTDKNASVSPNKNVSTTSTQNLSLSEQTVVKKEDKPISNSTLPVTKSEPKKESKTSEKEKREYEDNRFWYMRAGWNLMKCRGDDVADIDVKSKSGYQLAWGFEKPMGPLFWGMEFGLGSRGWKIQEGSYEKTLFSHNFFFSPFNVGYKYDFSDDFAVEAHIGIYALGDYFGKVKEINEYMDDWNIYDADGYTYYDIGMQFGFGVWYGSFGCDFLFQRGFVDWQKDMSYKSSNFMIRLGVKF